MNSNEFFVIGKKFVIGFLFALTVISYGVSKYVMDHRKPLMCTQVRK